MKLFSRGFLLCIIAGLSVFAAAQARPFPGPDVQQIYQRMLPQIEKIPALTTTPTLVSRTIRTSTPWPRLPISALPCEPATTILN